MNRPSAAPRVVRVFVSSTFRDMRAERDELVKRTFPALRKLCESRGVTWGEVDLRWGVTDEQKAEGQVLPICLAEIRGCRPYFIGLLGERYGWVPDALDPALVEQERWLGEVAGRSVTELEILHGVLNDPTMAEHTFFYLRDPAYVEGKSPDPYREIATREEIASVGPQEAERRAAERRAKLSTLKERIRSGGMPVREDYSDPRALGELVLADLAAVIERLYPAGSEPDPLDREAAEHEAFAASRSGVYIGRPEYFDRLDAHAAGDGPPLVILGESGSGKSALLANWALSYRAAHPDDLAVAHFIGASPASTDWAAMVRRIIGELSRHSGFEIEIPDAPDALRMTFANALHMAAAKGRVVLILDALNQLEDREGALDLAWLPPVIPANVRLVLSTLPGRSLAETERLAYPSLAVLPLAQADRERLIVDYLASYTKALSPALCGRIAESSQCANPLYLRTLLDELRLWGEHETLGKRIDHYLAAPSADKLYELILERYEADYERDRPGLVRDSFSLLWAARRGLSETELLDMLGTDGEPLPRAYWSPLFLATESSLASRSGLLGFSHDYLRAAAERRYLPGEGARQAAHRRIADYFAGRDVGPRKIEELPWQLARASAWPRLFDLLSDMAFLKVAWAAEQADVRAWWAQIEAASSLRMLEAYAAMLSSPAGYGLEEVSVVALLVEGSQHPDRAHGLLEHMVQECRRTGDGPYLRQALGLLANQEQSLGLLDSASWHYGEQRNLSLIAGDRQQLGVALLGQAGIQATRGRRDEALATYRQQEQLYRETGNTVGLAIALQNQAIVHSELAEIEDPAHADEALRLVEAAERLYRELGDPSGITMCLSVRASLQKTGGKLAEAEADWGSVVADSERLGDRQRQAVALGNLALVHKARGEFDEAYQLLRRQETLAREYGGKRELIHAVGTLAQILKEWNRLPEAMALHKEEESLAREIGDINSLLRSLGNQGTVLRRMGRTDEAMPLYQEQQRLSESVSDNQGLANSLYNQANVLSERNRDSEALALYQAQERLVRVLGNKAHLASSLGNQALIYARMGMCEKALTLHEEEDELSVEIADKRGQARSRGNQAAVHLKLGHLERARDLYGEWARLAGEVSDRKGQVAALLELAKLQARLKDAAAALATYREIERVAGEIGDEKSIAIALANQAVILRAFGKVPDAMRAARVAFVIASKNGLVELQQFLRSLNLPLN
ncbi:MAG TPA: tetratricopeptide repeat protein [Terriglobales bacterium]|nr:tetratricopeptide repeat protein [Terriglobales bacterium]